MHAGGGYGSNSTWPICIYKCFIAAPLSYAILSNSILKMT